MEKPGDNYGATTATAPDPLVRRVDEADELRQVELNALASEKLRLLWRHRRPFGRFLLVGLVIWVVVALLLPKWYDSTVRLMPPEGQSNLLQMFMMTGSGSGGGGGGLSMLPSLLGLKTTGALFVAVVGSDSVCNRMIDRFDLLKEYGTDSREKALKKLRGKTDVAEERKTGIISITASGRSPQKAQAMAAAYVEELSRVMNLVQTSSARRERQFLEQRIAAVKTDQDQASKEFSSFAEKNTAINVPEQAKASMTAAARLEGELAAAESELTGLKEIYTENNVRVKVLRGRIDELKHQLQTTGPGAAVAGEHSSLGQIIQSLPGLGVTWAQLYRRVMIDETVYEAMSKQLELAKVEEAKEIPTVSVLDPANLPERKSSPMRSLVVLGGMLLWFLVGAGWIAARDYWDRMGPDDERKVFVQELAAPLVSRWQNRRLPPPAGELPYPRNEE